MGRHWPSALRRVPPRRECEVVVADEQPLERCERYEKEREVEHAGGMREDIGGQVRVADRLGRSLREFD
jgi:hypothetical protein